MTLPSEAEQPPTVTSPQHQGKRRNRKSLVVLSVVAAVLLIPTILASCYVINLAHSFDSKTEKIRSAFPAESTRPQKTVPATGLTASNILILGSDNHGSNNVEAGRTTPSDQRSDVMMLLHIPADRKNVYSVSLMRDLWVSIPGHGEAKLNAALALGGVPLVVQTVETLFDQRIDHVAMINFDGFKGLTDALGGVPVNVAVPFTSSDAFAFDFSSGRNILDGQRALTFVRERYAFTDGDYQRVRNQQAFIKGIIAKTITAETLSNPLTVNKLVNDFSPFVAVDKTLDAAAIGTLAMELNGIRPQDVALFTLPTRGIGTSPDGQSIVLTSPAAIQKIATALAEDKLGDYIVANNFQNGN